MSKTNVASPLATAANKAKIPKALREQVWRKHMGDVFKGKCVVTWCNNYMSVFDFEVGHNIPESKGGATLLENLRPICSRCNKSMGARYTIDEWNHISVMLRPVPEVIVVNPPARAGGLCCGWLFER